MKEYNTIEQEVTSELTEKKSRFIATLIHIDSVKEAENILENIQKKYYDAKHNCYAYRVIEEGSVLERSSDDGEPSGTAGAPILNLLQQQNLCNNIIIVTRYFGGILLGTGGLVRAYSQSAKDVIEQSKIIKKQEGYEIELEIEYKDFEKLKYLCSKKGINIKNTEYLENITVVLEIKEEDKDIFISEDKINFKPKKYKILQKVYI